MINKPSPLLKVLTVLTPFALAMGGGQGCKENHEAPTFDGGWGGIDSEEQRVTKMMTDFACRCAMGAKIPSIETDLKRFIFPNVRYSAECLPNLELHIDTLCKYSKTQLKAASFVDECPKISDLKWDHRVEGFCTAPSI